MSSGSYHTAKYLLEKEFEDKALSGMITYMKGSFEKDGSYVEGFSYFDYPIKSMFLFLLTMGPEERLRGMTSLG